MVRGGTLQKDHHRGDDIRGFPSTSPSAVVLLTATSLSSFSFASWLSRQRLCLLSSLASCPLPLSLPPLAPPLSWRQPHCQRCDKDKEDDGVILSGVSIVVGIIPVVVDVDDNKDKEDDGIILSSISVIVGSIPS